MLEAYLRQKREQQEILLMTHIVLGYPDFETSLRLVETMVESGVELMELQIPFSEPIADGPVILRANQLALSGGSTVVLNTSRGSPAFENPPPSTLLCSQSALQRRSAATQLGGLLQTER